MTSARDLPIDAWVTTDFAGYVTKHRIVARCDDGSRGWSQSGVLFRVRPIIPRSGGGWIDADWFQPVEK